MLLPPFVAGIDRIQDVSRIALRARRASAQSDHCGIRSPPNGLYRRHARTARDVFPLFPQELRLVGTRRTTANPQKSGLVLFCSQCSHRSHINIRSRSPPVSGASPEHHRPFFYPLSKTVGTRGTVGTAMKSFNNLVGTAEDQLGTVGTFGSQPPCLIQLSLIAAIRSVALIC